MSQTKRSLKSISVKKFIDDYAYRIDLDADYQREKIWSAKQQEDLLDSILIDIDIPKIYLVVVKNNKQFDYECVDGKQRMTSLLRFLKPELNESSPLLARVLGNKYSYKDLIIEHPSIAKKIEDYELHFTIYERLDEIFTRDMFRRLQLGIRLNSGELLKSRTGTIRDFIYKDVGNNGPFFKNTNLSEKRFSRPFTLAQICINSFAKTKSDGEFVRARLQDIEDFFEKNHDLEKNDNNLNRIKRVLAKMDKTFEQNAQIISSRAVAVTCYLFFEKLFLEKKTNLFNEFSEFFLKLLEAIKLNMNLLSDYKSPNNSVIMEEFQKYILQASVEAYSINRRHLFIKKAFDYYLKPKTKGKILGEK